MNFEKSDHWPRWFKRRTPLGIKPALITDGGSPLVVRRDGNFYFASNDEENVPGGLSYLFGKMFLANPVMALSWSGRYRLDVSAHPRDPPVLVTTAI